MSATYFYLFFVINFKTSLLFVISFTVFIEIKNKILKMKKIQLRNMYSKYECKLFLLSVIEKRIKLIEIQDYIDDFILC